ncbi:hypothetical protein DPMN_078930 [Dreissena polymorpha]|uniref:Uncharacterized protein n=1 Tax=Dreissena polymorpha TaxID=45954 RepID=A0A9D3YS42_DREPO|nr:hypothetical protein DPMN_078930 [Dreissena polymorpha]
MECGDETNVNRKDVKLVPLNRLTSELNNWFKIYNSTPEDDEMVKAVQSDNTAKVGKLLSQDIKGVLSQRECGIDKDGSLCIKDTSDKRRKFILADGSISPTFLKGDIVHICSEAKLDDQNDKRKDSMKRTVGKIGRIVKVTKEATKDSKLQIKVGADTYWYCPEDVSLVSIVHLTRKFKEWLEDHRPQLENQMLGKAVLEGNKEDIREALTQKHQQNGVFGINDDGDVYVTDTGKKRQKLPKAEQNDDAILHGSTSMEPTRFDADGSASKQIVKKDDLVRVLNDQSLIVVMQGDSDNVDTRKILGKFGKVLKVKNDNAIEIEACGLRLHCSENAVVKVSLESLTKRLNVWFKAHWPEPDEFGKAVMSENYKTVGELLCNSIGAFNLQDGTTSVLRDRSESKKPDQPNEKSKVESPLDQNVSNMDTKEASGIKKESKTVCKIPAINIAANCTGMKLESVQRVSRHYTTTLIVTSEGAKEAVDIADLFKEETEKEKRWSSIHPDNIAEGTATAQVCHDSTAREALTSMNLNAYSTKPEEGYYKFFSREIVNAVCKSDIKFLQQIQTLDSNFLNMFLIEKSDYRKMCESVSERVTLMIAKEQLDSKPQEMCLVLKIIRLLTTRPVYGKRDKGFWTSPPNHSTEERKKMESVLPFWNYMFLWALVLEKQEVAKKCFQKVERATAMALIASDFYAALSKNGQYNPREDALQKCSEWTDVSKCIIDVSFSDDEQKTSNMLSQNLPFWDNNSCMELAIQSKKRELIAHPACQKAFDSLWEMGLQGKKSSIMFAMCIFFPVLAVFLQFSSSASFYESIKTFFTMSKTKFIYNMILYIAFLILFAYVLVFDLGDTVTTTQYVLFAWVVTLLLEEVRQMAKQRTKYFTNGWNVLDIIAIVLYFIGFGLRFTDMLNASRVVLAIDFVAFVLRLNNIFYVHNTLGPKLKMIRKMFQDLMYFLVIMAVFFFSYAISSYAILYPDSPFTWQTLRQVLRRPYWHLYGELFLEETEQGLADCTNDSLLWTNNIYPRCPSETGKIVVPIMMGIYLLVANIMLLNLLIAMFSFTVNELHKDSNSLWCFQRYIILNEYANRPVFCPPFNVFWLVYQLVEICRGKAVEIYPPFRVSLDDQEMEVISDFENAAVSKYINCQKLKGPESSDSKINTTTETLQDMNRGINSKLQHMSTSIDSKLQDMNNKISSIQTRMNKLAKKIK